MLVAVSPDRTASYRLDPESVQVGLARHLVRATLPHWGLGEYADLAELLVSELVTNALVHGTGQIEVRLSCRRGDLLAEVHDCGAGRPARQHPLPDDERGRGLELIDGLIELHGGFRGVLDGDGCPGKTVYVALSLAPDPEVTNESTDHLAGGDG
jgi:anti-sigma regulatory factor (Ser/Thr protein kinase)